MSYVYSRSIRGFVSDSTEDNGYIRANFGESDEEDAEDEFLEDDDTDDEDWSEQKGSSRVIF